MKIPINDVISEQRKRDLQESKVPSLMESIREVGLMNPITVLTGGVLVAGLHRLEACRRLGWKHIPCTEMHLIGLDAELAEIDENLIRGELTVLERGDLLKRRKDIYEAKYPETRQGGDRKSQEAKSRRHGDVLIPSFSADTAAKTGLSTWTIQGEVQIATNLDEEVKERLKGTTIANVTAALLTLTSMEINKQRQLLASGGDIGAAIREIGPPRTVPIYPDDIERTAGVLARVFSPFQIRQLIEAVVTLREKEHA